MENQTSSKSEKKFHLKKKLPPFEDQIKCKLHHSLKELTKTAKIVKAFLLQKEIRKASEKDELSSIKESNFSKIAQKIMAIEFNQKYTFNVPDIMLNENDSRYLLIYHQHIRIKTLLESIHRKIQGLISEAAKHAKSRGSNSGKKFQNIFKQINLDSKQRSEAMFVGCLQDEDEEDRKQREERKLQQRKEAREKEREKQKEKKKKKSKPEESQTDPEGLSTPSPPSSPPSYQPLRRPRGGLRNPSRQASEGGGRGREKEGGVDLSIYMAPEDRALHSEARDKERRPRETRGRPSPSLPPSRPLRSKPSFSPPPPHATLPSPAPQVSLQSVVDGKDWKQTGLHPSWAAKKVGGTGTGGGGLGLACGKRTVFSDDD